MPKVPTLTYSPFELLSYSQYFGTPSRHCFQMQWLRIEFNISLGKNQHYNQKAKQAVFPLPKCSIVPKGSMPRCSLKKMHHIDKCRILLTRPAIPVNMQHAAYLWAVFPPCKASLAHLFEEVCEKNMVFQPTAAKFKHVHYWHKVGNKNNSVDLEKALTQNVL